MSIAGISLNLPSDLSAHVGAGGYGVMLLAVTAGALVQGTIGFGAALVAVPAVALVAPEALPVTMITWVMPLTLAMVWREHHAVDWSGVGWIAVGRLPGSLAGAWVVTTVTGETLSVISGTVVLLAVGASLGRTAVPLTRATQSTAGFASGLMGTATSIGGPPLAILYQRANGNVLRSTLAACFIIGTVTSLAVLTAAGAVEAWQLVLAVALMPGLALGLGLSGPVARRLDQRWLRPAVLTVAAVTAGLAVVQGI